MITIERLSGGIIEPGRKTGPVWGRPFSLLGLGGTALGVSGHRRRRVGRSGMAMQGSFHAAVPSLGKNRPSGVLVTSPSFAILHNSL